MRLTMETGTRPTGYTGFSSTASPAPAPDPPSNDRVIEDKETDQIFKLKTNKGKDTVELLTAGPQAGSADRMSDMPEGEDAWRAYYEHPLTAATTAMLNINGAGDEQAAGIGLLYEYYKLPPIDKAAAAAAAAAVVAANDKPNSLPDLWSTAPGVKVTNGVDVFLATNAVVKREPEDLTSRKSPETSKATGKPNGTPIANGDHHPHSHDSVHVKQEPADSPQDPLDPKSPRTPSTPDSQRDMSSSVQPPYPTQVFANIATGPGTYDHVSPYGVLASPSAATQSQFPATRTTAGTVNYNEYYRDYYPEQYGTVRQHVSFPPDTNQDGTFVDRYIRQNNNYKGSLTVDLPSPDSGIGESAITPRDSAGLPQMFDYNDSSQLIASDSTRSTSTPTNRRPWTDFSRNSEADKIQIPKIFSNVGFRYYLEAPISTSQRREDDRITYINKGQFYGITMEYIPDPDKPLKSQTVKSLVMLVFREEKSPEEENKAWQFWHSRQHSVKQRILDADTKNSSGLVGCIEEVAHNTIAIYWNPLESQAKINVAVQCLSTDFSNQKGVKGLPLHLQIDTYDDVRESGPPVHRGYCQIKVFCDKGAERKTRDEERRAAKRKLTATGRKKMDELYHAPCDRSEFYSMSDLLKPPALFTPTEDLDKITSMELNFYSPAEDATAGCTDLTSRICKSVVQFKSDTSSTKATPPRDSILSLDKKLDGVDPTAGVDQVFVQPPVKRTKLNPPSDRVMLYVRREEDEIYNALHLVPPTLSGLATAIENKFKICGSSIRQLYKRSRKGITVKMDDDMIRHYSNEDTYIIEIKKVVDGDGYDVTLTEL